MKSLEEYIEGLKKEKEEGVIDEIADRITDKVVEKLRPVVPYCLNCPYYHTYTIATGSTHTYNSWRHGEPKEGG